MDESIRKKMVPGARIKVTQQIPMRDRVWTKELTAQIISFEQKPTGSWYAHAKDDHLWLDRLQIQKDDGELSTLILDEFTRVELLPSKSAPAKA